MNTVWLAFLAGLTTGAISCFAVQGGLLASSVSQEKTKKEAAVNILLFLLAKMFAVTLLGFLVGFIGSFFLLGPKLQGWIQIFVGLYMLATAARIVNLHPVFRYTVIQPPRAAFTLLRGLSKNPSFATPLTLGFLTVLIPCGITQAMLVLAMSSSSPLWGGLIMFAFTLGTFPLFFVLGMGTSQMLKKKSLSFVTAGIIAAIGIFAINTGQLLRGSVHNFQNYAAVILNSEATNGALINSENVQEVTINVYNSGYKANANTLKKGVPVRLTLITDNTEGCARAFAIPSVNYFKVLPK